MENQTLKFCFRDIVNDIVYPCITYEKKLKRSSLLEYTFPCVKGIFNAIFDANVDLYELKPEKNILIINYENWEQLWCNKTAIKSLLCHAKESDAKEPRIYQRPCLKEMYKFWAEMTTTRTYPIDNVINNINTIFLIEP